MQKNFWLYLTLIVCAMGTVIAQNTISNSGKQQTTKKNKKKPKKNYKFDRETSRLKREKRLQQEKAQAIEAALTDDNTDDDPYTWMLNGSHKLDNPHFMLRHDIDAGQATPHPGRTATQLGAHLDQEAP